MRCQVELHDDPDGFAAAVGGWLEEREPEHALLIGVLAAVPREPQPALPVMVQVTSDGQTVAAALNGEIQLILSCAPDEAIDAMVAKLVALETELQGVIGLVREAERFAQGWTQERGCP